MPSSPTRLQGVADNDDFAGGGRDPVALGSRYAQISLTQSNYPVSVWSEMATIAAISRASPLVFYRNASSTAEVYVCRRVGNCSISIAGPNHMAMRGLLLEECV